MAGTAARYQIALKWPVCQRCLSRIKGNDRSGSFARASVRKAQLVAENAIATGDYPAFANAFCIIESEISTIEKHIEWQIDTIRGLEEKRRRATRIRDHLHRAVSNCKSASYFIRRIEANRFIARRDVRIEVFSKHGNKCARCGETERLALDHIIPVVLGGLDVIENLQPLCRRCNSSKGGKPPKQWRAEVAAD